MRTMTEKAHHRNAYRSADFCNWGVAGVITTVCVYTFFFFEKHRSYYRTFPLTF